MSEATRTEGAEEVAGTAESPPDRRARAMAFEESLPAWQRRVSTFCENWIFAILVALIIRHFLLEPYRIPSASMEPILYGDPAITEGDFVLVDKVSHRFRATRRWDVTVFKYPVPEIDTGGGRPAPARLDADHRRDGWFVRPLLERYFVKRCLITPGDVFYFAGGDLFLQGDDGDFATVRKPEAVQEGLWTPIYRCGAQPDYLPWRVEGATTCAQEGGRLRLAFGGGEAVFTQPINNLYLKPGPAYVVSRDPAHVRDRQGLVDVSMLRPQFRLVTAGGGEPVTGNVYRLDEWQVHRVTSADADRPSRGKTLNGNQMPEPVGDVRVRFRVEALAESLLLRIAEGSVQAAELRLAPEGWRLTLDRRELAAGGEDPTGRTVSLAWCDDRLTLAMDGRILLDHAPELAAVDPARHPLRLAWAGEGAATVAELEMARDVHYCRSGILADQLAGDPYINVLTGEPEGEVGYRRRVLEARQAPDVVPDRRRQAEVAEWKFRYRQLRGQFIPCLVDADLRERLQDEWRRNRRSDAYTAWLRPLGVSRETALRAPENGYLMLGDNSPFSYDGRNWGWVPRSNLRGRVLCIAWWPSRIGLVR